MRTLLRPIAVSVEEPVAGQFRWLLSERGSEGVWSQLRRAPQPVSSYRQAMAEGLMALEAMIDDLEIGPRSPAGPQPAPPRSDAPRHPTRAPKPGFFGFGPAR